MKANIVQIMREAGQLMLDAHDVGQDMISKEGRANFVTKYDVKVQEFLIHELTKIYPNSKFLGEEGENNRTALSNQCFIIDPIDGTTNFIFGYQHSAISLAYYNHDGIDFATVYNPYLDELFYAKRGEGAYCITTTAKETIEQTLHVSDLSLSEGIAGFGTSPYRRDLTEETFFLARKLYDTAMDIRRTGSAALDICYVAAGRYVLFAEHILQPWDYAAAALILEEAGGRITNLKNDRLTYEASSSVLAGTPKAHQDFLNLGDKHL